MKYAYEPANANLAQSKAIIANMENAVSEAMTNCAQFFGSMDATSKAAMQQKFDQVMKTGQNALQACRSTNVTTTQAVEAMSLTDSGLVSSFT